MAVYSIGHIEELTGIKSHTLRIWEKRYNVFAPQRTDTKIRFYNDDDLKQLLKISFLNKNGFKISKIAEMSSQQLEEEITRFVEEDHNQEAYINKLIISMINLDEDDFEQIMDSLIASFGLEIAIMEVIYPFLSRVGIMWVTNNVLPYQEHFISNLIRQKIIVGIDKIKASKDSDAPKIVLCLPEWELHEIGLLLSYYRLKMLGFKTYYLGTSVPQNDLKEAVSLLKPDMIFSILTVSKPKEFIAEYLNSIAIAFPSTNISITSNQFETTDSKQKNLFLFKNISDTLKFTYSKLVP